MLSTTVLQSKTCEDRIAITGMEFPFGHSHHHQHHQEEEEEEEGRKHSHQHYPQRESNNPPYGYPPPGTQYPPQGSQFPPPPQHFAHVQHHEHQGTGQVIHHEAHPSYNTPEFGPPPPNPYPRPGYDTPGDSFRRSEYEPSGGSFPRPGYEPSGSSFPRPGRMQPNLPRGQVVRVSCKADSAFSLAVRNGSAVLVHANANDESQQWIKDETFSVKVKDERSYPSFALVNKATGQALKHSLGGTQPVLLAEYRPDTLDESILWSMSEDMGHGYRTLRQVNNIRLNMDAFHGDKKSGGIKDGNAIVLWEWKKGDNQLWKIVPY